MKISRLLQVVFVGSNVLLAVPVLAASAPAQGVDQPVSLCDGEKSEKADKGDKKSDDKKATKDEKPAPKEPART
jgi:hypothetical protein